MSIASRKTKYIELREIGSTPKTKIYGIFSVKHGEKLAEIRWYFPWRQFTIQIGETVWNENCWVDMLHFLHIAKVEGRVKR